MAISAAAAASLPRRITLVSISLPLWILLVVRILAFAGVQWDVAWHRSLGRESFWSPPHLVIYASLGVVTLIALWVIAREGWVRGYGLVVLGGGIVYLSAPFDELWHRWYGLDVDIWSPPHLSGIAGGFIIALGSVYALAAELGQLGRLDRTDSLRPLRHARATDWTLIVFIALLLTSPLFAMGRYTIVAVSRDAVFYPIMAGLAVPAIAVANLRATGYRWTATLTGFSYIALMLLMAAIVMAMGLKPTSAPPLLLIPALAMDLFYAARRRTGGLVAAIIAGVVFSLVFYWTEYAWKLWLVGFTWRPDRMLIGLPLSLLAGGLGGSLGYLLGNSFRDVSSAESANPH
ncbi:MAG TPA: hypothetical protein VJO34_13540 [Methylomirabilota bacterium]|nr:hypothetical protein [Methylomirabilota bacterium]